MSEQQSLSRLPKVSAVLAQQDVADLVGKLPRWAVVQAVRDELAALRAQLASGAAPAAMTGDREGKIPMSAQTIETRARLLCASPLRRVVNATGVVLHTNLGRAPLAAPAIARIFELAGGYCNLEYQLDSGQRGSRQQPLGKLLRDLTGAEAHLVVNNNAAAVLLALAGLCQGREVVVSRGELVEIGGSFRVPDVMRASGAFLREVGTTNRTHPRDYVSATGEATAAYLKVHRSNFAQVGFVTDVGVKTLADLAHQRGLLCLYDLGAGALASVPRAVKTGSASDQEFALADFAGALAQPEPTVAEVVAQGVDLVMFSGDKLLGGPQAGILCGKAEVIAKLAKQPLLRALRPDKLTLLALVATLELYRDGRASDIPTLQMLQTSEDELARRAEALRSLIEARGGTATTVRVRSAVGGGSQPLHKPWSWAVSPVLAEDEVLPAAAALRRHNLPVIARVSAGKLLCDVRTIADADFPAVADAVCEAMKTLPMIGGR